MMDWRKTDEGIGIGLEEESEVNNTEKFDLNMTETKKEEYIPSSKRILKSMLISEIVDEHPDIVPEIMNRGMHCVGCSANSFETLEEGFMMHGMEPHEIDKTVEELNAIIDKNSKPERRLDDEDDFL